jgi:hypothetical protein
MDQTFSAKLGGNIDHLLPCLPAKPPNFDRSATHVTGTSNASTRTQQPVRDIYTPPPCILANSRILHAYHAGTRRGPRCFWKELNNAAIVVHARRSTA